MTTYARYDDKPVFDSHYIAKSVAHPDVSVSGVNEETVEQLLKDVHRASTALNLLRQKAAHSQRP